MVSIVRLQQQQKMSPEINNLNILHGGRLVEYSQNLSLAVVIKKSLIKYNKVLIIYVEIVLLLLIPQVEYLLFLDTDTPALEKRLRYLETRIMRELRNLLYDTVLPKVRGV